MGTSRPLRRNHFKYVAVAPERVAAISRGRLGPVVEIERGNGPEVCVSFGHGGSQRSFEEQVVPEGHYCVLGSNRDDSIDSRQLGPLGRERIPRSNRGAPYDWLATRPPGGARDLAEKPMIEVLRLQAGDNLGDLVALSKEFFSEYQGHHEEILRIEALGREEIVAYFSRFLGTYDHAA